MNSGKNLRKRQSLTLRIVEIDLGDGREQSFRRGRGAMVGEQLSVLREEFPDEFGAIVLEFVPFAARIPRGRNSDNN